MQREAGVCIKGSISSSGDIAASVSSTRTGSRTLRRFRWANWSHWPFLTPALFFITLFIFIPAFYVLYLSLFKWNLLSNNPKFVGLSNYVRLFSDVQFLQAIENSGLISLGMIVVALPISLGLATLADLGLRGTRVYRTILFGPYVIPLVASGLIWSLLFNGTSGLVDQVLSLFGIQGPNWLADGHVALFSVLAVTIWQYTGYYMLIFIGGLQNVPQDLKEAAKVDGAGTFGVFRHVTLPSLSPSLFFAIVVSLIQSCQTFDQVYVMTGGGPDGATSTLVYYIFNEGFGIYNIGPATAGAVVLLVILAVLTAIQLRFSQRWVVEA